MSIQKAWDKWALPLLGLALLAIIIVSVWPR
jgi:hypothetical protein